MYAELPYMNAPRSLHINRLRAAASLPLLLLLTACGPNEPHGQVIAVVNGVEITLAELNAEARARNLAIGSDRAQRDSAIADLINRKLLVQAAHERGLDQTPQFILAERRLREIFLAQQIVAERVADNVPAQQLHAKRTIAHIPAFGDHRTAKTGQLASAQSEIEANPYEQVMAQILGDARKTANIKYQPGFRPIRPAP
ncbi:MAG: hypothetical protein NVS3B5_08350 [Sphingomicrobium sp.]